MTTESSTAPHQEAVEAPPRGDGTPEPDVLDYPTGHKPVLEIAVAGRWCLAIVRQRLRFPDGSTAYTVTLDPGTGRHEARTYWWPLGMRVKFVPDSAPAL